MKKIYLYLFLFFTCLPILSTHLSDYDRSLYDQKKCDSLKLQSNQLLDDIVALKCRSTLGIPEINSYESHSDSYISLKKTDSSLCLQKIIAMQQCVAGFMVKAVEPEGFLENSLVKVPSGYQPIQNLVVGDVIHGLNDHQKIVVNVFQQLSSKIVQLKKGDDFIYAACHQKFYLPDEDRWIKAQDITASDIVLSKNYQRVSFDSIEVIDQDVNLYGVTVQDHIYKISSQDILVHNMAAIIAPYLTLSFVEIAQPVLIMFGSTLSLNTLRSYPSEQQCGDEILYSASPEKIYFDSKYAQLKKLQQDMTGIHSALKFIKSNFKDQQDLLNIQMPLRNNLPDIITMTAQWETELDFDDRFALTEIRQKILDDLEADICKTHISIGLYIDEFFYRKDQTIKFYIELVTKETDPFYRDRKLTLNCPYETVKRYYEHLMTANMLLAEIEDRNKELSAIIQFFEKYNENSIFGKTSNLFPLLAQEKLAIEKNKIVTNKTKQSNEIARAALVTYFNSHPPLPDAIKEVSAAKTTLYKRFQGDIKIRSQGREYGKIEKPQKPDDDDELPRIYVGAKYHAKNATSTKSAAPTNGQAALDCSFPVSKRIRVGISENEIVVLGRTLMRPEGGSEWHGYATTWDDLNGNQESDIVKTLKKNNLVKNNGKIL